MRLKVLLLIFATFLPASASADIGERITVEISESEVLSLFYFVRAATGAPYKNPRLKQIWIEHAGDEEKAALDQVKSAMAAGPGSFTYHASVKERPRERYLGRNLSDIFEAQAGESDSLEDFGIRMTGLLPVAAQATFIEALRTIQPLHRKHVWNPSRAFVPDSVKALRRASKKHRLEERLAQVAKFYGSTWPSSVPIRIYLVGVPGDVEKTYAHSAGPIEVVEVVEGDRIENRLAVIFHELCHSLYAAQPLEKQLELEALWRAHPLPDAAIAYAQINEGLATALGNGWLEVSMSGAKVFDQRWYSDAMVDGFAKTLYPLVVDYLENERSIDASFVNYAVALFVLRFPDAVREPGIVFRRAFLGIGSAFDARRTIDSFRGSLRSNSVWSGQPIGGERALASYQKQLPCVLAVDSKNALDELAPYPEHLANGIAPHLDASNPLLYIRRLDNRWHVVVVANDTSGLAAAFERLAGLEKLEDGLLVHLKSD